MTGEPRETPTLGARCALPLLHDGPCAAPENGALGVSLSTILSEKVVLTESLPALHGKPGRRLRVVAVEGGIGDWAAYAHYADEYDAQGVAADGHKLFEDDAVRLFPVLNPQAYRR